MDLRAYRRDVAELEHQEAKAWREFKEAEKAGLKRASVLHSRHRRVVERLMKVHDAVMSEIVREQSGRGERAS